MLRYLRRLADRDLALDRTMIPLGSCTMKLNATTEMVPITWPEFAGLHPFAPADESVGLRALIAELEALARRDHRLRRRQRAAQRRQPGRARRPAGDPRLPPLPRRRPAHGVPDPVQRPRHERRQRRDGRARRRRRGHRRPRQRRRRRPAGQARRRSATAWPAIMVTYPSTHGVFEEAIGEICDAVHEAGGQVYVDGANLNALVGVARPGHFGADVSHLNLHKTFCIPHGGGGPGVGPVGVRAHLAPFLPGRSARRRRPAGRPGVGGAVRVGRDPADPVGVHRADGSRRAWPGRRPWRSLSANYVATRLRRPLPRAVHGRRRAASATSASSTCGRSPSRPASPSTTSPSG